MRTKIWAVWAVLCLAPILPQTATATAAIYYRSIGVAPDYSVGTVIVQNGETLVVGDPVTALWRSARRGQGDRITIGGVPYTVLSVDAENEITLTSPYVGPSAAGVSYVIARKFTRLRDWNDCVSAVSACPGVSSNSLVADDRVEVGVIYPDATYMTNVSGERIELTVVTDVTHTITMTVDRQQRHHGIAGTGVVLDNGNEPNPAIVIQTDFVTLEWIELKGGDLPFFGGRPSGLVHISAVSPSNQILLRNLIVHDDDLNTHGIFTDSNDLHLRVSDSLFYGDNRGILISNVAAISTASFEIIHNTFFGNNVGIDSSSSSSVRNDVISLFNNLAHSDVTRDFNTVGPNPSSSHNWSGDTSGIPHSPAGGGANDVPLAAIQFLSTSLGTEDFHVRRGVSVVEDQGVVVGSVPDDLDGRLRSFPDIGADEASTSSANPVKVITSKSTDLGVVIEWQNPDSGPLFFVRVYRSTSSFPAIPSGAVACTLFSLSPGKKASCADGLPLTNGTTYYYSAFVYDTGGNFSTPTSVTALPFDTLTTPARWSYTTSAATLAPAGIRHPDAFIVSNDHFLHAMVGSKTTAGGVWPANPDWAPYRLPVSVQHRPAIVPISGMPVALLAAQNGRVYAVNTETGRLVWRSIQLGATLSAAPVALVGAYGATGPSADKVFVGTADAGGNAIWVLELGSGMVVGQFDDAGAASNIGTVSGLALDYPAGPVYFTSTLGPGASPRSVWALDVSTPATPTALWSDNRGHVDAAPSNYKGKLFVGTRNGELAAYDAALGAFQWSIGYGNGPIKTPIVFAWPYDTMVFTSDDELHSVQFTATGGCAAPPCTNWTIGFASGTAGPLVLPGTDVGLVGLANGTLEELTLDRINPTTLPGQRSLPNLGIHTRSAGLRLGAAHVLRQRYLRAGVRGSVSGPLGDDHVCRKSIPRPDPALMGSAARALRPHRSRAPRGGPTAPPVFRPATRVGHRRRCGGGRRDVEAPSERRRLRRLRNERHRARRPLRGSAFLRASRATVPPERRYLRDARCRPPDGAARLSRGQDAAFSRRHGALSGRGDLHHPTRPRGHLDGEGLLGRGLAAVLRARRPVLPRALTRYRPRSPKPEARSPKPQARWAHGSSPGAFEHLPSPGGSRPYAPAESASVRLGLPDGCPVSNPGKEKADTFHRRVSPTCALEGCQDFPPVNVTAHRGALGTGSKL